MKTLHRFSVSTVALLVGLGTMPALAQQATTNTQSSDASNIVQGDVSAENGIEQGLKSGQLTSEEAARLEAHQDKIDKIESHDLRDGQLSTNEQNRIDNAELKEGSRIVALDNNGVTADPDSKSSTRMANDVQRDVNQENRILNNTNNGNLTDTQVGALERGQARVDGLEAKVGGNNVVDYSEQNRIRTAENGQSANIRDDAHGNVTVNHVRANNDGSLTALDSNGKGDRDHDRIADRDNSNGKDFDRDNHHGDFDRSSNNNDHDGDKDHRYRDDRITTAQNGDTGNRDQENRSQNWGGDRDKDGDHDRTAMNQASSTNDSAAVNANSNTGASANTGMNSTTNNSVTTNTGNSVSANTGNSVNGTLNGQSVTASNASSGSMAGTAAGTSSGMHSAVTTPHVTPHPTITHIAGHH